eukprot:TRINITY_DN54945_c0_g1_i1.p1 TRINITY_DN54945_c0_g1~~TRINITY_DN54945_c0_g1_i1.p1  ORF type:complete len:513 (-),score=85.36 TRINITY_DN54945_c0_g1_i1:108-1553(-)
MHVKALEYAVRGPIVVRAVEMEKEIKANLAAGKPSGYDFDDIIYCNVGNPQQLGQTPITFSRQVQSILGNPQLLSVVKDTYKPDVLERASAMLKHTKETNGAYTQSPGFDFVRESVAEYIQKRDGGKYPCDIKNLFLSDGASKGIQACFTLLVRGAQDGVMIPIPQYPLYTATLTQYNATAVPYYLEESKGWGLDIATLGDVIAKANKDNAATPGFSVRAMVVINPGNPTGAVLSYDNIKEIIQFAHRNKLVLFADEVYQENIYDKENAPFHSFRKVMYDIGGDVAKETILCSFHSISKGMTGECGLRGGYMELLNWPADLQAQLYKLVSVGLCPNVFGQWGVDLMVKPPAPGQASYEEWNQQYQGHYESLKRKAGMVVEALNKMKGVTCNAVQGAMYVFPSITLPPKAVAAAEAVGKKADAFYCTKCLERAGIVIVPGSGFGQKEGTWHFRCTFLPAEGDIAKVTERLAKFHDGFMKEYE